MKSSKKRMLSLLQKLHIFVCFLSMLNIVDSYHTLLFTTTKDIRIAILSKPRKVFPIIKDLNEGVAIDFFYNGSLVCWTDHGYEVIQCATYNGTHTGSKNTIAKAGVSSPDGIACDWLTRKLYWTDGETKKIEVVSIDSKYRKVLFWQELDQPRGIAVDPTEGLLFWTDWGEIPKIERAAMNGDLSSRKVIISKNIFWPNSINLDIHSKQLYWLDGKLHFIEITDYDGRNRKTIAEKGVLYPFALTIFADKLYWSDWKTHCIHMMDRKTNSLPQDIVHGDYIPMDIEAWDPLRQPYKRTPCEDNNGGCSHLCLLSPYPPGYSCACPTGIKLNDNQTCAVNIEHFLLLVQRSEISKISLDSPDYTNVGLPLKGIKHAIGIDFDPVDKYFYWTDDKLRSIRKAKLDGSGQDDVINTDIYNPDGISIDWYARNMYWSDTAAARIEVARLDGKYRKVLIIDDLGEPRAVAVSPEHGWLFWSDWNEKKPKIERADLDGTNRVVIVKDGINWPNGIALDYSSSKLYWGDAKVDKIEMINMDGTGRREILAENLPHVFSLTLLGEHLFFTDWQRRTVDRINKYTGRDRQIILEQLPNVMGLKAVELKEAKGSNQCKNNETCGHLCLTRPYNRFICVCEIGYELNEDGKTCVIPEAFLVFSSGEHIRRISIKSSYNSDVLPLTGIKSVSSIDIDIAAKRLYWADNKLRCITKSFLNGSQAEKIVEFGLHSPESIAVDWLSYNIYWVDTGNKRIEVSTVNGQFRKVLFWRNLREPRNLVLSPMEGYMYWSEWFTSGIIVKAAMDGSTKKYLISDTSRVNGMTIDFEQKNLYWSQDNDGTATIEVSDFDGRNRQKILHNDNYKPFSLAQYQDYIYWVNWNDGSVVQGNKMTGRNYKTLYSQYEHISDLKLVHSSKQTGWSSCMHNNGGCSHLCLVRPGNSTHSPSQNCTCPTHYTHNNGSCVGPDNFILIAQRNTLSRIITDSEDCADYPLGLQNLKNVRAVEYDPISKFIYWIDGKVQAIKRGYENGSYSSIFLDGSNNGHYTHFYDLSLDPFNQVLFWSCSATDTISGTRLNNSISVGTIFKATSGEKPRNIAVHPEKGLLFWTDLGTRPRITRSRLDGQKRLTVVTDVQDIECFTIDRVDNIMFFAIGGNIHSCDFNGGNKKLIVTLGITRVTGLSVMGTYLYWADKDLQRVERINKLSNDSRTIVAEQLSHITDMLTVVTPSYNTMHFHPCSEANVHGYCSHLCITSFGNTSQAECSCPLGLTLNDDKILCSVLPVCGKDHFTCSSGGECIPISWKCDGQTDCPDSSDEVGCPTCKPHQFKCHSGLCIDISWVCDGTNHCVDGSDEMKCCSAEVLRLGIPYFQCVTTGDCIASAAVCDNYEHCSDGSDETQTACDTKNRVQIDNYANDSSSEIVTVTLVLVFVCLTVSFVVVFGCRKKRKRDLALNIARDEAVLRPLAPTKAQYANSACGVRSNPVGMATTIRSSSNSNSGSNERGYVTGTGVSSSASMVCFPLNPPPSPATVILRSENRYKIGRNCCELEQLPLSSQTPRSNSSEAPSPRSSTYFNPLPRSDPPPTPHSNSSEAPSPRSSTYRSRAPPPTRSNSAEALSPWSSAYFHESPCPSPPSSPNTRHHH